MSLPWNVSPATSSAPAQIYSRQRFLRSVASLAAAATCGFGSLRPASAQVGMTTVWDPADYGQLVKELTTMGIISQSTAESAAHDLALYNEYHSQHKINLQEIWPQVQPALMKLASVSKWTIQVPTGAQKANQQFSAANGDYQPSQDYPTQWEFARAKARRAIQSSLVVAQQLDPELKKQALTVEKLVKQPVKSESDLLALNANLSAELARQAIQQRQQLNAQTVDQAQYIAAVVNEQEATRRNPGMQRLLVDLQELARQSAGH